MIVKDIPPTVRQMLAAFKAKPQVALEYDGQERIATIVSLQESSLPGFVRVGLLIEPDEEKQLKGKPVSGYLNPGTMVLNISS